MRLTFADFQMDLRTRELRQHGTTVPVQPLIFDLLSYLIEHRDRVVSKEELLRHVWGGVVVGRASINQAVSVLRRVVDGFPATGSLIATARGRGYRFVGDVAPVSTGEPSGRDGNAAGRLERPPFVGRQDVMAMFHRTFDEVLGGQSRLVLLSGEPGIGKTRVCEEIVRLSDQRGVTALVGHCFESEDAPPYQPWFVAIRQVLRHAWARERVPGRTRSLLAMAFPGLGPSLGDRPGHEGSDPVVEAERFELFDRIAALWASLAEVRPLLVVLEDIHSADLSSLRLLEFVLDRTSHRRILFVATFRDAVVRHDQVRSKEIAGLAARPNCVSERLPRLQATDVAAFVRPRVAGELRPSLVGTLSERSGGNPLLLKGIVSLCVGASGTLDEVDLATTLPSAMATMVDRHLDVVPAWCRAVLSVAAVLGFDIEVSLLTAVTAEPRERVVLALDEAVRAEILVRTASARLRFAHSVIGEVLYESLPSDRRAELHARAGEALAAADVQDDRIGEVARHFFRCAQTGHADRSAEYSRLAAVAAMRSLAFEEAVRHASNALAVLAGDAERRLTLLLLLADAWMNLGELQRARDLYRQASTIARQLDRTGELAQAAYGIAVSNDTDDVDDEIIRVVEEAIERHQVQGALRVRLLTSLANARWFVDSPEVARRLATRALDAGRRAGDPDALALALTRGLRAWHGSPAMIRRRVALTEELVGLLPTVRGPAARLESRWHLLWNALERGDRLAFDRNVDGMLSEAAENRHPYAAWNGSVFRASRLYLAGRFADAATEAERGRGLPAQGGEPFREHVYHLQMLAIRRTQGRFNEYVETYRRLAADKPLPWRMQLLIGEVEAGERADATAIVADLVGNELRDLRRDVTWFPTLHGLADLCALLEASDEAGVVYRLLAPYEAYHFIFPTAWMYGGSTARQLGKLAVLRRRWGAAARHFETAIERDRRMGAAPFVALGRHAYAAMLFARGGRGARSRAQRLLHKVRATAVNLDMDRLRQDAEHLLGQ